MERLPKEIDPKPYLNLVKARDIYTADTIKALDLVKKFILQNNHILIGGQAIDYALRLKGGFIYDSDVLPDYDIVTPNFHTDAYVLGNILVRAQLPNISVINALHPSTMKVRVNTIGVCDISYVPLNLYKKLPTLDYQGIKIIHPYYQFIDQHKSLSHPYEGIPRPTILSRLDKDMKRHDILYEAYKLSEADQNKTQKEFLPIKIDSELLADCCVGGYAALLYWLQLAHELGFKEHKDLIGAGEAGALQVSKITELEWDCYIPAALYGFSIYTDNYIDVIERIQKKTDIQYSHKYKAAILNKVPRRILMFHGENIKSEAHPPVHWEIFDNNGSMVSAYRPWAAKPIWISNLQHIMCLFMTYYWYYGHSKRRPETSEAYKTSYLICRDIIAWADKQFAAADTKSRDKYMPFLPTEQVYGAHNWTERFQLSYHQFREELHEEEPPKIKILPKNVHLKPGELIDLANDRYSFDPTQSHVTQFNGKTIDQFFPKVFSL